VHLSVDVDLELCETVRTAGSCLSVRICMRKNRTSVVSCSASRPSRRDRADGTIDGDRVMERLQERPTFAVQLQDPVHALVVVDDVEVTTSALQDLLDAQRIRERLAEAPLIMTRTPKGQRGRELARAGIRNGSGSR